MKSINYVRYCQRIQVKSGKLLSSKLCGDKRKKCLQVLEIIAKICPPKIITFLCIHKKKKVKVLVQEKIMMNDTCTL